MKARIMRFVNISSPGAYRLIQPSWNFPLQTELGTEQVLLSAKHLPLPANNKKLFMVCQQKKYHRQSKEKFLQFALFITKVYYRFINNRQEILQGLKKYNSSFQWELKYSSSFPRVILTVLLKSYSVQVVYVKFKTFSIP